MAEDACADVGDHGSRQPSVPTLVPYRDDRGEDAGRREHPEDHIKRLEVFLAKGVVDQELQAQRHDDVEQRLDHDADADEHHHFPVVLQERLDERIDRRQRAGGFLGGKDDEILVVLIVIKVEFIVLVLVIGRRRRSRLAAGDSIRWAGAGYRLLFGLRRRNRIIRRSRRWIIRRWRLGRHETNRCCTAGMTAKSTRWFYAFGKATANNFPLVVRAFAGTTNAQSSAATLSKNE